MAKQSGSSSPKGLRNSGMTIVKDTNEYDKINKQLGKHVSAVFSSTAKDYKEATGKNMPNDVVQVYLGRGGLDGTAFNETLKSSEFSNIKTINFTDRFRSNNTYVTGYKSLKQLEEFVTKVENIGKQGTLSRLERAWNRR